MVNVFSKKKVAIFFVVLTLIISSLGGMFTYANDEVATKITIFHTNDLHGRIQESSSEIGYAKIAGLVNNFRQNNPNTLLLDAGDTLHGLSIATLEKGESVIKAMNALKYDAMTPGNHDFNYGYERLLELREKSNFPFISANIKTEKGENLLDEYIIKEIDGIKVGIFGLSTPETTYKTNPKNVEGLVFEDPSEIAAKMVEKLKEEKADVIIALGHLGIDEESVDTSIKVVEEVKGIDIFIDGHSHSTFEEGLLVGDTLIASTGDYGKNIGVVEISILEGKIVDKSASLVSKKDFEEVAPEEEVKNLIESIAEGQNEILSEVIGEAKVRLDGERELSRVKETNLGNLVGDIFLHWTDADIALVNGGGIRASIEAGNITTGDVVTVFPFGNTLVVKKLDGAAIKAALEHGTKSYPELAGGFPHVAGMKYAIDLSKPVGDRVVDITVNGAPLDLNKKYTMATNDFIAAGGDGYTMIAAGELVKEMMTMDEAVVNYIKEKQVIETKLEGRILVKEVEEPKEEVKEEVVKPVVKEEVKEEAVKPVVKEAIVYIVKPGDWLSKIAIKYNTTWQKLQQVNNIKNADLIFPGQKIIIPAS